ncbi:MAG: CoA-transferase [Rubrivivax sp.]
MNIESVRMPAVAQRNEKVKIVTAQEAVRLIRPGDTVATGGFVGTCFAEGIALAIEAAFLAGDEPARPGGAPRPQGLTLVYAAGQGDGRDRGLNHLAHEGLVTRIIGGHYGLVPRLQKLAMEEKAQAYNLPQGVILHLYRDIAGRKPGHLSRVGLGTFVDPRFGGGKVNASTTAELVELVRMGGEEYLFYKAFPIDVGIIRATTADPDGNLTMEREALTLEMLDIAMAVRNSGGVVIAQVERLAARGTLSPRRVEVPGIFVDCVVVAEPEHHWQTFSAPYNPAYASELIVPPPKPPGALTLDVRKLMARRGALELRANAVVNLGIGIPEGVATVAAEEKVIDLVTLTAESGVIGGNLSEGLDFGTATNHQAMLRAPSQFDFYDGGGLDIAFLGMAELDAQGNVNVSKFGPKLAGAGGFINISQNAKKVVFLGTFTAGRQAVRVEDGRLHLATAGNAVKLVNEVQHRTFSGEYARRRHQQVMYVTERCVFRLVDEGLELVEIAAGVDLEADVLSLLPLKPLMRQPPRTMDARLLLPEPMGLRDDMLGVPLAERFSYDPEQNTLFINMEGATVRNRDDAQAIGAEIRRHLEPLPHKAWAIVNYDNYTILPDALDAYAEMVREVEERYYLGITRYTTSSFLRAKLGRELEKRDVAPHIYESAQEARSHLRVIEQRAVR